MRTKPSVVWAIAAGIAVLAAACGQPARDLEDGQATAALDGAFATIDGGTIDLAELRGQDVVLWFWAPW